MATLEERMAKRQQALQAPASVEERIAQRRAALGRQNRNPNGTYGQAPEGSFMNGAGQVVDPALQDAADARTLQGNMGAARAQEFVQGTLGVGEYFDEALGMISQDAQDKSRRVNDAFERQHPVQAGALNVTGAINSAIPAAAGSAGTAAVNFISRGRGVLGRGLRSGIVAAPAAAAEGALQEAGREHNGGRLRAAGRGAATGAGMSVVLGPTAALVGAGAKNLAQRFKKLDVRVIADEFGISMPAAREVRAQLANDDLDAAMNRITRAGDDAMLADAGPATRNALDSSMQQGGEALAIGRQEVSQRATQAGQRFNAQLDGILGSPDVGVRTSTRKIAQRTAEARKAAYNRAYAQPTPMVGEGAQQIESTLGKVDPDTLRAALKEAQAEMRAEGYTNQNIMATIAEDGSVTFSQPLSVLELDFLARGLANIAEEGTDSLTGQMSRPAQRAMDRAMELRNAMRDSVPGYGRALNLGRDNIREKQALVMGRKLLSPTTTREDVIEAMRGAPKAVKDAARQGLRQNVDAVMARARTTLTDIESGNFDFETGQDAAREALTAVKALGSRDNMQKMRLVLGGDARKLSDELQRMADVLALRAAVARNSATAIRTAGREAAQANAQPGLLRQTAGNAGSPFEATRAITQAAAGTDAASIQAIMQTNAADVVRALTQIRGPEAQRALAAARSAINGQPLKDAEAALIGRLVGGALVGAGGDQTGTQLLGSQ